MKNSAPPELPVLIAGPTGSGKTAFAVELASRVGGEIICADAFQIYQGMGVLTAQPDEAGKKQIPHHLFGVISPFAAWNAARWLRFVEPTVREIQQRNHIPILVGGTGLYFRTFTHGLDEIPQPDPELRAFLAKLPIEELARRLHEADPDAPALVDMHNPRRIQRALEIVLTTGRALRESRNVCQFPNRAIGIAIWLHRERAELRQRIAANVSRMLACGAMEEVQALHELPDDLPSARAIGFREIRLLLAGKITREECESRIITATCQYARRQETWFRHRSEFSELAIAVGSSAQKTAEDFLRIYPKTGQCGR